MADSAATEIVAVSPSPASIYSQNEALNKPQPSPEISDTPVDVDVDVAITPSVIGTPIPADMLIISTTKNKRQLRSANQRPQIAIIIDDLGYQRTQSEELLAIGRPLSYAVIPNTPYAKVIAADIVLAEQELMLHVPMQTISERKWEQGLTENMTASEFNVQINTMLNDYPHAKGINNHGGSLLTQNNEKMQWLMASLQPRGLYFVDSRTTSASVARDVAMQNKVQSLSRDVFLDNDKNMEAIAKKFERVKQLATKNGHAIAIGHPYRSTIDFLVLHLPEVEAQGFDLVFVSDLLAENPQIGQSDLFLSNGIYSSKSK